MSGANTVAPVIIKRKKVVVAGGHHGGAWKVAYADFVTAMMAFFMLMWLLNATTETQRQGIADYFTPTIAITRASGGGDGVLAGNSVLAEQSLPLDGRGATSLRPTESDRASGAFTDADAPEEGADAEQQEAFRSVEDRLKARGGESLLADPLFQHIVSRVTDEGLVIELFETDEGRLFDDADMPTPLLASLVDEVRMAAAFVTNPIAIEAHTAAFPLVVAADPSWSISRLRADAVHALMLEGGLPSGRVQRITAHADREPAVGNPMARRNNRIEIVLLRQ